MDTQIFKDFDAGGIELSGGEAQKLAICRAYYKNAHLWDINLKIGGNHAKDSGCKNG